MAVTIYDVAKKAGVGIGTVSRAINDSPQIRPETKQRVMDAIRELGYSPHSMAKRLARRKIGILAAIMPFYTGHFYQELLRGIQKSLAQFEYDLLVYYVDKADKLTAFLDRTLKEKRCDGVMVISMDVPEDYVEKFTNARLPVVVVDRAHKKLDSVQVQNEDGAYMATHYLIQLGHRRIAMIAGNRWSLPARQRHQGYLRALQEVGIPAKPDYYVTADGLSRDAAVQANDGFNEIAGKLAMEHLLAMPAERPTAIFAASDILAIGAIQAIRQAGLSVPEDMAVIGFDDIELAKYLSLTTVQQPMFEMGRLAVETVMEKIEGRMEEVKHILLSTRLVERGSTTHKNR